MIIMVSYIQSLHVYDQLMIVLQSAIQRPMFQTSRISNVKFVHFQGLDGGNSVEEEE